MVKIEDDYFYNTKNNLIYTETILYPCNATYQVYFDGEGNLVKYNNGKWEPVE